MNDQMFASMAEQMQPDEQVLASLQARLDAEDAVEPTPSVTPLSRRRRVPPARWWIGIAAACAAIAVMIPASGQWPVQARGSGTEPAEEAAAAPLDYAALYRAATAAAAAAAANGYGVASATDSERSSGAAAKPTAQDSSGWQTNTQVSGIDEGDIVKSDGSTIFVASGKKVAIVVADGARTRQVATIDTSTGQAGKQGSTGNTIQGPVVELDLQGSTLIVLATEYRARESALPGALPGPSTTRWVPFDAALTKALLYDVSDPASPRFLDSLGQSGGLLTTRLTGNLLYVVTDYTLADSGSMKPDDPQTFVPVVTQDGKTKAMDALKCGLVPEPSGPTYTVVSSIDLSARKRMDTQSVLGGTGAVFMSTDNLFLAAPKYNASAKELAKAGAKDLKAGTLTQLARIGIADGRLSLSAQGVVAGTVLNQFALDEFEGKLRVVTSVEGQSHKDAWIQRAGLFVLDSDLKVVGSISSLVSGESVQSVRFSGPIGYVVTFRQMDPLFAVDLSDAAKPRVLSALKIPGFSTYLQQWSADELLGLGRRATTKGEDLGLKLSIYNTADPLNVTESAVLKVPGDDAEALHDHRAVLADTADGLVGFAVSDWSSDKLKATYRTFRYQAGTGFVPAKALPLTVGSDGNAPSVRGMVIGDYLYLASAGTVSGYATDTFDRVAHLTVKN